MKYILFWLVYALAVMLVSTLIAVLFEAILNKIREIRK